MPDLRLGCGHRNDYESASGPDQVLKQSVDVEVVTENYGAALTAGRRMPPDAALPVAARARHLSDLALAHTRLGRDGAALDVLLTRNTSPRTGPATRLNPGRSCGSCGNGPATRPGSSARAADGRRPPGPVIPTPTASGSSTPSTSQRSVSGVFAKWARVPASARR